jgi:hypothetical protein
MEWHYTKADHTRELAQLNFFSMTQCQPDGNVNFQITARE